jgi:hypothetical protein
MIDPPGDHPLPHPELDGQEPIIFIFIVFIVHQNEILYRPTRAFTTRSFSVRQADSVSTIPIALPVWTNCYEMLLPFLRAQGSYIGLLDLTIVWV